MGERDVMQHAPDQGPAAGLRERKKRQTQARICDAAGELFTQRGYAAVTTQEVAQLADIGAGTLFRYASTKAELLLMVMNERLRLGAERGLEVADRGGPPSEAIVALVEPLMQAAVSQPENTAVYQREVLFGAGGPYRAEALERIRELEGAMVAILGRHVEQHPAGRAVDVERAAAAVFSVLYLKLVRHELGRVSAQELPAVLRSDIDYLLRELLGPRDGAGPDGDDPRPGPQARERPGRRSAGADTGSQVPAGGHRRLTPGGTTEGSGMAGSIAEGWAGREVPR